MTLRKNTRALLDDIKFLALKKEENQNLLNLLKNALSTNDASLLINEIESKKKVDRGNELIYSEMLTLLQQ